MNDLFDNVWGDKSEVVVDHFLEITLSVRSLLLAIYLCPNISTRLPYSPLAPQVVYAPFQTGSSHDNRY